MQAHMFWAYGHFGRNEILSSLSFVKLGYELNVWSYGSIENLPTGARLRDARFIIPENKVFLNRRGQYASFSDLFRYSVLRKLGGLYSDTDVIALIRPSDIPTEKFLVTEYCFVNGTKIIKLNNNVIFSPMPLDGDLIDLALSYASRFPKEKINWSEIGPDLLNAIVQIFPEHGYVFHRPEFANPFGYWETPEIFLSRNFQIPKESCFIHLYNEMWRLKGIDKEVLPDSYTFMDNLQRALVDYDGGDLRDLLNGLPNYNNGYSDRPT